MQSSVYATINLIKVLLNALKLYGSCIYVAILCMVDVKFMHTICISVPSFYHTTCIPLNIAIVIVMRVFLYVIIVYRTCIFAVVLYIVDVKCMYIQCIHVHSLSFSSAFYMHNNTHETHSFYLWHD